MHGPHDDSFYKYLAGLESEYEGLKRSGYSGEGFHSRGTRLGVGSSHNLPPHLARLRALEAAEKRKNRGSGGGRRLGGGGIGKVGTLGGRTQLSPKELALKVRVPLDSQSLRPPNHRWECSVRAHGLFPPLLRRCWLSADCFRPLNEGSGIALPARLGLMLKGRPRKPQRKVSRATPPT